MKAPRMARGRCRLRACACSAAGRWILHPFIVCTCAIVTRPARPSGPTGPWGLARRVSPS